MICQQVGYYARNSQSKNKGGPTAFSLQVGMEVAPQLKDSLNRNFFDLLGTFRQISGESVQNQLVIQRVEVPEYLTLYSPAISWILQCIAYRAPEVHSHLNVTYLA